MQNARTDFLTMNDMAFCSKAGHVTVTTVVFVSALYWQGAQDF